MGEEISLFKNFEEMNGESMKKTGIITHYDVHNHGAVLQLYASRKILEKLGYDAKALKYKKNYDFMELGIEKKYSISIKSVPFYLKYLVKNGLKKTLFNIKKRKILHKFNDKNSLVGEFYSKSKDLELLVIGSDEIFSIESGLNPCFFGMGINANKIISYAASFGPTTLKDIINHNAANFIKAGLETIDTILVRDENTRSIVEHLCNKPARIVCDPVLLYDFKSKLDQEINDFKKKNKRKYCLIYSYDYNMNDCETVNAIKKYAKDNGLRIYSVGYYHKWVDKNINVKPLDLFLWFSAADTVFTDTFHGTVISISMNVNFFSKVTLNANKLGFLLKQYDLENRRVASFREILDDNKRDIDIDKENKVIADIRYNSLKELESAINNLD